MKSFIFRIILFTSFCTNIEAQNMLFSDTYPISNVDSIEQWLVQNTPPSVSRLKNLIRLERTYYYNYQERFGRHFNELQQLSETLNNDVGRGAYNFLNAYYNSIKDRVVMAQENMVLANTIFTKIQDTSGIIHALTGIVDISYNNMGTEWGFRAFLKENLDKADFLLSKRFDVHDLFMIEFARFNYLYAENPINTKLIRSGFENVLRYAEKDNSCNYMLEHLLESISITYYFEDVYESAYQLSHKVLNMLKKDQIYEQIRLHNNLKNTCEEMNKYDEVLYHCYTAIDLMNKHNYFDPRLSIEIYNALKDELSRRGQYEKALDYANRAWELGDSLTKFKHEQNLIDFQSKYQSFEKQKQIAVLTAKQAETENRNFFIYILLLIASIASGIFAYLWTRLRYANETLKEFTRAREQFFAIIAHDLRRPFHAFQGMNELMSYYLKKQDYGAVERIAQSIDESGLHIRQLLDNLLKWALSQKKEMPYKAQSLNLLNEIQTVVDIYRSVYTQRNVQFLIDCPQNVAVWADRNALEMILRNLISNALNAFSNESGIISIKVAYQDGNYVTLFLSDNGKGMEADKIADLKTLFNNPNSVEAGQNGFGFGLILVAKFAKKNGININFDSKINEGTYFNLVLPLAAQK